MRLLVCLLLIAIASAACDVRVDEHGIRSVRIAEGRAEDAWSRTYTLPSDGSLEIAGEDGTIDVRGADISQVEVQAEREARADSEEAARELLRKLDIREDVTATSVRIATSGGDSTWVPPGLGRRAQTRVQYRVRVPPGLRLTFKTANGGVRLTGVTGRILVTTNNGGVTAEDLSGSVVAKAVNGGVRVDLASIAGDVVLSTTNGGIRLTLPSTAKVNLQASAVNGRLAIDDEFGVTPQGEGASHSVTAAINGGGPNVSATTLNGAVRIRARAPNAPD